LSLDKHLELLKAYSVLSKEGKEPVSYKEVGKMTVSQFRVSGNNKFFESIGFLSRVEKSPGDYLPTNDAIDIYKDLVWKKDEQAKKKVSVLVARSWFWQTTRDLLAIKGKITEEELIQHLGREVGAEPTIHLSSLKVLVSYLRFSDLVAEENGLLFLNPKGPSITQTETGQSAPTEAPARSAAAQVQQLTTRGKNPILFGILISPDSSEDQIRRVVRTVMEELDKIGEKSDQ
jgi:hypothetical protein